MPRPRHRSFTQPEETRTFPHGSLRIITPDEIISSWRPALEAFARARERYLIYQ